MSELSDTVINTHNEQRSLYNGRKASMVRVFGQEHSANFVGQTATMFFPVDTDMAYISELGIKFIVGEYGGSAPSAGGAVITPPSAAINTYSTFSSWVEAFPIGAKIDMDNAYGYQCWDYADAFWVSQVARALRTGPNHSASECWTYSRVANAGDEFDLIYNLSDVKRGDWIVKAGSPGHIAMAGANYSGNNILNCYGQNQGGVGITLTPLSMGDFLGAFRYKKWN